MYRQNVSGQPLFLAMLSAISGNPVTGIAAAISGRKSIDGGAHALLSGSISELGGGQYVANLYDFDTNGKVVGFYFTASGCVPVSYTVVTDGNVSGRINLSSGSQVGLVSGQQVNLFSGNQVAVVSGTQVNTFSGWVFPNSGLAVGLLSGTAGGNAFASGILDQRIPRAVLVYDYTGASGVIASGTSGRCLLNATRKLVNKFDLSTTSGYLSMYQEDDTTIAFQQALTSVSGAAPLTGLDTR